MAVERRLQEREGCVTHVAPVQSFLSSQQTLKGKKHNDE